MVQGVTAGYEKRLEIQGVGYRAQLKGKNLELAVGYSHPVPIPAPDGIEFEVPQPTRVVVKGISKQLVGETRRSSASSARPSRTRARASATRASTSSARSASAHDASSRNLRRRLKRRRRVRAKIAGTAERPRISVFRSNRGISAQLIDDVVGPHDRGGQLVRARPARAWRRPSARSVPASCSPSAPRRAGVEQAVFDRGGYRYHGHVRAFAEAIREGGITV